MMEKVRLNLVGLNFFGVFKLLSNEVALLVSRYVIQRNCFGETISWCEGMLKFF